MTVCLKFIIVHDAEKPDGHCGVYPFEKLNLISVLKGKNQIILKKFSKVPWELQCICPFDRLTLISVLGRKKQIALEGF